MPELGEIRRGRELGHNAGWRYIWQACQLCGKQRWVQVIRRPFYTKAQVCSPCSRKKLAGANSPNWRGGRTKQKQRGYIEVYVSSDDFFFSMAHKIKGKRIRLSGAYVGEHRLVMAKHLGRCLLSWEHVHHKNGIRDDNRIENLELTGSVGEHIRAHSQGYLDGYRKGLKDGRNAKARELLAKIQILEANATAGP